MQTLENNTTITRRNFLKGTSVGLMSVPLFGMAYSTDEDKVRFDPKQPKVVLNFIMLHVQETAVMHVH